LHTTATNENYVLNHKPSPRFMPINETERLICNRAHASNPVQTVVKDGISPQELRRISAAAHELKINRRNRFSFIYLVLGDDIFQMPAKEAFAEMRNFQKHLMTTLKRYGLPPLWLNVLEVRGGLHANYFFLGSPKLAANLAVNFARFCKNGTGKGCAIQLLTEQEFDTKIRYVFKERSTQTNLMVLNGYPKKTKGSHRLEGQGDRVRLSNQLTDSVITKYPELAWKKSLYKKP